MLEGVPQSEVDASTEALRAINGICDEVKDALRAPHNRKEDAHVLEKICVHIRDLLVKDTIEAFRTNYQSIMTGEFEQELLQCGEVSRTIDSVIRKQFLKQYVYNDPTIIKSQISASRIVRRLLDVFVPAALDYDPQRVSDNALHSRIHILLSENYRAVCAAEDRALAQSRMPEETRAKLRVYNRLLLATDYICGMTDSYAKEIYGIINAMA